MPNSELISWVDSALSSLPVSDEPLFQQLWVEGKLKYLDCTEPVDTIDVNNAKLLCTLLERRSSCCIVLSDDHNHRGPLMFSTALIKSAMRCIQDQIENHRVLYFGTSIGIKYSLSKTVIRDLTLDSVFTYTQVSGKYDKYKNYSRSDPMSDYLPEVICVYHPNDPREFIQIYNPNWVAVDCHKELEILWLDELLTYCKKKSIPVLAWSQNNFSNIIRRFQSIEGHVYFTPKIYPQNDQSSLGELFADDFTCSVEPVVFSSDQIGDIDKDLHQAKQILRKLADECSGTLERDALKTSWIYLRTIERLALPVSIYNSEAKSFRFVYSFDSLDNSLSKYIGYIEKSNADFSRKIEDIRIIAQGIVKAFDASQPPYWSALSEYCMDRSPDNHIRVLVFTKQHQKQLFTYTLLSRYNIGEDELLEDSRLILRTLKEIANPNLEDRSLFKLNNIVPIVAGLPDFYNTHLFYRVINNWPTKVLIYNHQLWILNAILKDFNTRERRQFESSIQTISSLSNSKASSKAITLTEKYQLEKKKELPVEFKGVEGKQKTESKFLSNIGDFHTELTRLLEFGDRDQEDVEYLVNMNVGSDDENAKSIIVDHALVITFYEKYRLLVDFNEQVNVLRHKNVEKSYVKGLRNNDIIVLIENQSRQSLYDLIIARVHNHPSLEIHMGMLRKWKEEFFLGYSLWKEDSPGSGLNEFLKLIQLKGSRISSPLTISNWVNGYVMRPQDEEDIKRLGEILDLKFLKDNYKRIYNAASRIVGIHISLSRKLNECIESKATNYQHSDLEIIDEELGLTFGELRSSIKILKIREIYELNEPIMRSHLGRLETIEK